MIYRRLHPKVCSFPKVGLAIVAIDRKNSSRIGTAIGTPEAPSAVPIRSCLLGLEILVK